MKISLKITMGCGVVLLVWLGSEFARAGAASATNKTVSEVCVPCMLEANRQFSKNAFNASPAEALTGMSNQDNGAINADLMMDPVEEVR